MSLRTISIEGEIASADVKAEKAPQAAATYSTPHLVDLGRAHDLVQGSTLNRNYTDWWNGYTRDVF